MFSNKKIITYKDYINDNKLLEGFKLYELKNIARYYKLHISGSKLLLFKRIEKMFITSNKCIKIQKIFRGFIVRQLIKIRNKIYKCIKIQKIFRGFIVRQLFKIRSEGYKNRLMCVNESDFYSLEPLNEIPFEYFYIFNCNKFIYGCNIISFIYLIKSKKNVKNPYNREDITEEVIKDVIRTYSLIKIIFGLPEDSPLINNKKNYKILCRPIQINENIIENRAQHIRNVRSKPLSERIHELFMDIDQLGNYTQSNWFSNLQRREYIRLFRTLYDIWIFRGQLSRETKLSICVLYDPFIELNREYQTYETNIEVIQEFCLRIMENMVYCGIDDEYRKIGALHVLTALTYASIDARIAMPWLYDSLI